MRDFIHSLLFGLVVLAVVVFVMFLMAAIVPTLRWVMVTVGNLLGVA